MPAGSTGHLAAAAADPPVDLTPVSILLVDDDPRNLDVLESLLEAPDYNLVRATNPDQALMLLLTGEFAVIVLDIRMPTMSGIELAGMIKQRKRTRHVPIIFLTAYYQQDQDVLAGYGSGGVDYLTKPIVPEILCSKIAVFVDLFRKTQALAAANRTLQLEIGKRLKSEEALRANNDELEARVRARTADLSRVNEELRAREVALTASEAQAQAAARAKDEFLAALSHELRTPLNPVLLLASHYAADPALSADVRAQFDSIRRNVTLEARLIDDLLDLTRISRGLLPLAPAAADIDTIVKDAIAVVRPEIEEKGLELTLDLGACAPIVRGDAVRLQQVFWNLLRNSVKFTPKGGNITLATRTEPSRSEVVIQIADSGIGLSPEELDRIFEAFVQGEHARERGPQRYGGLGLGLAISRKLVELHGGTIRASSRGRDRGAAFTVTLPLWPEGIPPAGGGDRGPSDSGKPLPPESAASPLRPGRHAQILLVEDHAPTRSTLVGLLARRGYDVTAAASAAEARARVKDRPFHLIISDIGLPDAGGCELLAELRGIRPGLPGIALSGYGQPEDLARSRQAGFAAHLIKPVVIEELDAAIQAALRTGPPSLDEN